MSWVSRAIPPTRRLPAASGSPKVTTDGEISRANQDYHSRCVLTVLADRTARLSTFFSEFRSLAPEPSGVSAVRLAGFLEAVAPYLRKVDALTSPTPAPGPPGLPGLKRFLEHVREPLEAARADGAMLNIWDIAGLKRDEVRNARVLAALFDPNQSGNRAAAFLSAFVDRVCGGDRASLPTADELKAAYSVQTEACPLGAADSRVDLSIEGETFILLIEVKIDAGEGAEQLARYAQVLASKAATLNKRAALVYLSPLPAKAPPSGTFYADWSTVNDAARTAVAPSIRSKRTFQDQLLVQFAHHIRHF